MLPEPHFLEYMKEQRSFCQDWLSFQTFPSPRSRAERVCGVETNHREDAPGHTATYCGLAGLPVPAPLYLYLMLSSEVVWGLLILQEQILFRVLYKV